MKTKLFAIQKSLAVVIMITLLLAGLPVAQVYAAPMQSVSTIAVGAQTGTLTYGTAGSATFLVTVTSGTGGNKDIPSTTLSVSGLPTGATGSFSTNPISCTGNPCVATSTLTVTTLATAPAVTADSFTVSGTGTAVTGTGSLTINKKALTVTADDAIKTYGDTKTFAGTEFTTLGLVNGDTVSSVTLSSTGAASTAAVGNYNIVPSAASGSGLSNYTITYANGILTVGKAILSVTADDQSITYGDSDPAFTFQYAGFKGSDTSADINTPPTCSVSGAHSNAGSYTIACSGGVDNNYSFSYTSGTLTVGKATLSVTADDQSITYGDSDPVFTFQYSGFVSGDTSADVDTPPTCGVAGAHSNVGTYTIACSGGVDNNYSFSYTNGTLTVDKATLDVTADDQSITYGDSDPAFTFAYNGFVGADDAGDLTTEPTCSVAGAHSNAGNYTIACSGGVDESYNFNYVDGTLTVDQVTLDVTADDQSITYGDSDPVFTFQYSGFVSGDTSADVDTPPTCGVAGAHSNAGSYAIACSGGVDNNYVFSYTDGTLTVAKASLTVTADNQFILVGDPDPAFTFQYSGFVGSDTSTVLDTEPTCGVSGSHSSAGTYPITCSGGTDNNYDFSYVDGTLTVSATNNPPTDISLSNSAVDENKTVGTTVGALSTTDPDLGDTHTYSLVDNPGVCDGTDNASFQISGSNLQTNAIFDFETKSSYVICVETNDAHGATFQKQFTITINNLVETIKATFKSKGVNDGWVLESGETTNIGGTMNAVATTFLQGDNAVNRQYRSILSFNTSSLPDNAVITKVIIRIRRHSVIGTDPFLTHLNIVVDIRKGGFSNAIPLELRDFQSIANKNVIGIIKNTPLANNWYAANLNATSFPFINKLGNTQLRLRFQKDDNNDLGADYLRFYSGNGPLSSQPMLIIHYHLP